MVDNEILLNFLPGPTLRSYIQDYPGSNGLLEFGDDYAIIGTSMDAPTIEQFKVDIANNLLQIITGGQ
jgi:hypothetical protein